MNLASRLFWDRFILQDLHAHRYPIPTIKKRLRILLKTLYSWAFSRWMF